MNNHRFTRIRNVAIAVAGLGLAIAAPASAFAGTQPAAHAAPASSVPQCLTRNLSGSLQNGNGGAGSVFSDLTLRNTGSSACRVGGFPGVSYVASRGGHQVGAAAIRLGFPDGWVTIEPGRTAAAQIQEVDALNFPSSTCHITSVAGLRVYPPNQTKPLFVAQKGQACANRALTQLTVRAF